MAKPQTILCPRCHKPGRSSARFCQHCGHDMVLNNAGPRYYLTRVIKSGGQGAVYEGVDDAGAVYAIKEMLDDFADAKERAAGIARFTAEAELLERLTHPRIPRIYAHFADEGRHYLVMDLVRGEDLAELVAREGALPEPRVLAWAEQICDVLGHLHDGGMIYRDMKPANVMVEPGGTLKLIDFGIAKVLKGAQRGTQIGTPGYAPPEQYQGIATRESDVYALGATLHHLLTGRDPQDQVPFSFPQARAIAPSVSQRTTDALARALQMRPEDRFAALADFCNALGLGSAAGASPAPAAPARSSVSRPAARQVPAPVAAAAAPRPAAGPAPTPAPVAAAAAPRPAARSAGCGRLVLGVTVVLLVGLVGLGYLAFSALSSGGPLPAAPTAQTLVQQPFLISAEIIVPVGIDDDALFNAFAYTYEVLAREQFGAETQVVPGSFSYQVGQPELLDTEAQGARYRAELRGEILVPQP